MRPFAKIYSQERNIEVENESREVAPKSFLERVSERSSLLTSRSSSPLLRAYIYLGLLILLVIATQVICILFNYYDAYKFVYPGSKVSANINSTRASRTTFFAWKCIFSIIGFV